MSRPHHKPTGFARFSNICLFVVVFITVFFTAPMRLQAAEPDIVQVKDNLYRFTDNDRAGVFLVTSSGIILGDPLSTETAQSLQTIFASRFNQTVKYIFYSHLDAARAAGAEVFTEQGAVVIAHANTQGRSADAVSPATVVFSDSLTISLGADSVDLHYLGTSLTDDMIIAHFPEQEAVFASDFVSVERLPDHDISGGVFPDWFSAIDKMNRLDYVYLLPGNGNIGIKNDAIQHGYFLREVHNRVRRATAAGVTLDEMTTSMSFDHYRRWANYSEQLPNVITGMHKILSRQN